MMRARRRAWARVLAPCLLLATACGGAVDTPEEAFVKVQAACARSDWARLFDTFPPDTQQHFTAQIAAYVESVQARAKIEASAGLAEPLAIERILVAEMGVTVRQWEALLARERFAIWFQAAGGAQAIKTTGFDPELVVASEIVSVEVQGATARMIIDDRKGHRSALAFVLVDRLWRLDLGYE